MTVTAAKETRVVTSNTGFTNPLEIDQYVEQNSHLRVFADATELTLGVDYTIDTTLPADGVEITITATGLLNDPTDWVVFHDPPMEQAADLSLGGRFGLAFEQAIDALARRLQAMDDRTNRALRLPVNTDTAVEGGDLPTALADNIIGWNAGATALENKGTVPQLSTVAGIASDIATLGPIAANITTVAGVSSSVTTVAGIAAAVSTVSGISSSVSTVAGIAAEISALSPISANITTVAGVSSEVATVAGIAANVTTVAGIDSDIATVVANITDIQNAVGNAALAADYAQRAEDSVIPVVGGYSALHWAAKAAASAASVNLAALGSDIIPDTDGTRDLGSESNRFAEAHVDVLSAQNMVGQVAMFAMSSPPTGWLKANGAAVSRTTYAALFDVIGTTFGSGDGSTTFNLPDMRGEFARGWDDSRGVDSGRAFGSAQSDMVGNHTHGLSDFILRDSGGTGWAYTAGSNNRAFESNATQGVVGTATETRPRNIALLYCIKF